MVAQEADIYNNKKYSLLSVNQWAINLILEFYSYEIFWLLISKDKKW